MLNLIDSETAPAGTSRKEEISRILEALLFASSEPLSLQKLREILSETYPVSARELRALLEELEKTYSRSGRPLQIEEIAEGFLIRTTADVSPYIQKLYQNRRGEKLSKAAMEVLAILAFKGPYTRAQIEAIRGVDSSGTLASLGERGLVDIVGRLDAPGRPPQYGVTKRFLKHFGLRKQSDLSDVLAHASDMPPAPSSP